MKNSKAIHSRLGTYRYEFLLVALLLLIFDKIFFPDHQTFITFVWPFNMVLISIACFGIFYEQNRKINTLRNVFGTISIIMPFGFMLFSSKFWFIQILIIFFAIYYSFIFSAVMYQIIQSKEVRVNVILGSFCGYMLLSLIALFSYLLIELNIPESFHGISKGNMALIYNEMSYFSFITLTSIGFGDIYPNTDMARLVTVFFGMAGQFYMAAVVGIIISKFSSSQ